MSFLAVVAKQNEYLPGQEEIVRVHFLQSFVAARVRSGILSPE